MEDPKARESRLFEIASRQGGYFTAKQARKAGYSYRVQHYHRNRGHWMDIERGIFRLRNFPESEREDLIRWSLWSFNRQEIPQAVFSHETALAFHELGDFNPGRIHLTIPSTFRKAIPGGCIVHRGTLLSADIEEHAGFRVTVPIRSLVDAAKADVQRDHLLGAINDALSRGMVRRTVLQDRFKAEGLATILNQLNQGKPSPAVLKAVQ